MTEQLQRIERDIRALADKLKDQQTRFDDPTLAASQRDAIRAEGQKTGQELQAKQAEGQDQVAGQKHEILNAFRCDQPVRGLLFHGGIARNGRCCYGRRSLRVDNVDARGDLERSPQGAGGCLHRWH